jgi:hypothetical protein
MLHHIPWLYVSIYVLLSKEIKEKNMMHSELKHTL